MQSKIIIEFETINGIKVDERLLKTTPQLRDITKKTITILCDTIKKYFKDHKINVKTSFILENE